MSEPLPDEIQQLIEKAGSPTKAEKLLGLGHATFKRIETGKRVYTDSMRERVIAALNGEMIAPPPKKAKAKAKAKSNGHAIEPPPVVAPAPEFVLWDGKSKGTYKTKRVGPHKPRTIKNVPQPVLDLLEKYDGNANEAARAMGMSGGSSIIHLMDGKVEFTERKQRAVWSAMHGVTAAPSHSTMGQDYDKYTLGLAICLFSAPAFDRINDIADILNGRLVFKKSTKSGWLVIYKLGKEDLHKFKKLALRDANEIVCP